ncbi:MAG: DoxX family membrane protein [Bifidobacteriaceae bacterium]|nr:DoxX family membrane protein [Bifidobacteriaceae bacterium]
MAWWGPVQPWLTLAVRLGVAAVALAAAIPKFADLRQSQRATAAYEVMPVALSNIVGIALPVVELAVGLLLLVGLLSRYAAGLFGLMMVVFIIGIAQAWARGLNIDCGCFGGGGALPAGAKAAFGLEIARDLLFLVGAVVIVRWPRSALSLDGALRLTSSERTLP